MVLELIPKINGSIAIPFQHVTIDTCFRVRMSPDLSRKFKGYNYVELYYDREIGLIGLKPSKDKMVGYTLKKREIQGSDVGLSYIQIKNIFKDSPIKESLMMPAKFNNGMVQFKLKEGKPYLKAERKRK